MSDNFFMRNKNDELLFWKYDLGAVIQQNEKKCIDDINSYDKEYILNTDMDILCHNLNEKYKIDPIILHKDKIFISGPIETKVDISQDRNRAIRDRSRPHYIMGIAVTFIVPFEGDAILLDCKASAYTMNPPRAKIKEMELHFTYYGVDPDSHVIQNDFDKRLRDLEAHIKYTTNDIVPFNKQLIGKAKKKIEERRERISKSDDFVRELKYQRKHMAKKPETKQIKTPNITKHSKKPRTKQEKWDFFICHASEDKNEVAIPIHDILTQKGYKVWLDKYELKIGDSLRRKIEEGLNNSRYGVVILSPHFFAKKWPQDELDGLFALGRDGKKRILPIWHHLDAEDVRKYSPILAGLLGVKTVEGIEVVVRKIVDADAE